MIASIVEHEDHASARGVLAQQSLEKVLERRGVENRAHHANELTAAHTDGAETRHGLARGRMQ